MVRIVEQRGKLAWVGLATAPTAWFLHQQIDYGMVILACEDRQHLYLHLVTIAALLLLAAGVFVSWQGWRQAGAQAADEGFGRVPRNRFLAAMALLFSGLFFLLILGQELANHIFDACMR